MSTHPYVSDWRASRLPEWREADLAERVTLEAPELRHVSDPAPAPPRAPAPIQGSGFDDMDDLPPF